MSYAYDLGGNRSQSIDAGVTTNYTANDVNEYSQIGTDIPAYDDNGNLTVDVGLSMNWDAHKPHYSFHAQAVQSRECIPERIDGGGGEC